MIESPSAKMRYSHYINHDNNINETTNMKMTIVLLRFFLSSKCKGTVNQL